MQNGGVHGIDDLLEGDVLGWAGEQVTTGLATATFNEAGTAKVIQNLHEKISGDGFTLRKLFESCKSSPVMLLRKLSEGTAGVF